MIWKIVKSNLFLPILLVLFCALYFLGPLRLCAVVSGSMEPNLPTWSLCVVNVKTPYEQIETGDIVVYLRQSDGKRIIHRVIEIRDEGMVTKGDANKRDDGLSVTRQNLYGKYLFHIPKLGKVPTLIRTVPGMVITAVLAIALIFWMVAGDVRDLKKKAAVPETPAASEQTEQQKEEPPEGP